MFVIDCLISIRNMHKIFYYIKFFILNIVQYIIFYLDKNNTIYSAKY
jgi:hypothetical protein